MLDVLDALEDFTAEHKRCGTLDGGVRQRVCVAPMHVRRADHASGGGAPKAGTSYELSFVSNGASLDRYVLLRLGLGRGDA